MEDTESIARRASGAEWLLLIAATYLWTLEFFGIVPPTHQFHLYAGAIALGGTLSGFYLYEWAVKGAGLWVIFVGSMSLWITHLYIIKLAHLVGVAQ